MKDTPLMLEGRELFQAAQDTQATVALWWLGQHSFLIKLGNTLVLIDPFLSPMPERLVEPLFAPGDATNVDLIICTHDHADHIDPFAITGLAERTAARFVAPRALKPRMRELGVPLSRLELLNDGESVEVLGVVVHAIKAAHERFDQTDGGLFPYLGYVLQAAGVTIYHAGDTVWWEGLQGRLAEFSIDLGIVPINGRDAVRYLDNVVGNMVYQEAADLLGQIDVPAAYPSHYGMFSDNTEDPSLFSSYVQSRYPNMHVLMTEPGQQLVLGEIGDGPTH